MTGTGEKTVLAIDPGHAKCGVAVARRNDKGKVVLLWRAVVKPEGLLDSIRAAYAEHPFSVVVVGSGTKSSEITEAIREMRPKMEPITVDEKDTTLQARERYWHHNPRRWWRRLLPSTMQVPPEPVDDFVALILAERYLLS